MNIISIVRPKKIKVLSGNQSGENFFNHSTAHTVECVAEYIFLTSTKQKKTNKQKKQEDKKDKKNLKK